MASWREKLVAGRCRPADPAIRGDHRRSRRADAGPLLRRPARDRGDLRRPEGALAAGDGKSLMFQQVSDTHRRSGRTRRPRSRGTSRFHRFPCSSPPSDT